MLKDVTNSPRRRGVREVLIKSPAAKKGSEIKRKPKSARAVRTRSVARGSNENFELPRYWFKDSPEYWFQDDSSKRKRKRSPQVTAKGEKKVTTSETLPKLHVPVDPLPTAGASAKCDEKKSKIKVGQVTRALTSAKAWVRSTATEIRKFVETRAQHEFDGNIGTALRWLLFLALAYVSIFDVGAVARMGANAGQTWHNVEGWLHSPQTQEPQHMHNVFVLREPTLYIATPSDEASRRTTERIYLLISDRNVNPITDKTHKTPRVCMRVVSSERTTFTIFSGCYFAMKFVKEGEQNTEDEIMVELPANVLQPGKYVIYASLLSEVMKLAKAPSRTFSVELPPDGAIAPPHPF